jgi:hypothetical protein
MRRITLFVLTAALLFGVAPLSRAAETAGVTAGQAFGNWYQANSMNLGSDNVHSSSLVHTSTQFAVALDSLNRPHVVWSETGSNNDIYYSRWDGNTWTGFASVNPDNNNATFESDNVSSDTEVSVGASIALFGDRPYIAWSSSNGSDTDIFFKYWNGATWTGLSSTGPDDVSTGVLPSAQPVIDVYSNGVPHIAWTEGPSPSTEISYVRWTGSSWSGLLGIGPDNVSVNATESSSPSLSLANDGTPNIAWTDTVGLVTETFFARWTGSAWAGMLGATPDNVSLNSGVSTSPSLDMATNTPVIAWRDNTPGNAEVFVSRWSGTAWAGFKSGAADNVSATPLASVNPSLRVNSSGNPSVTWVELIDSNISEVHYTMYNGTTYTGATRLDSDNNAATYESSLVTTTGANVIVSLGLETNDNPAIFWSNLLQTLVPPESQVAFTHWFEPSDAGGDPTLERVSGPDRIQTAIKISQRFYPAAQSADHVVLARNDIPADALAASPLTANLNAVILLNPTARLDSSVRNEIARVLKPGGTVFLMGQTKALSAQVDTDLNNAGFAKRERIGGARRQETSVLIAQKLGGLQGRNSLKIFVANGFTAVDALVAGSAATLPDNLGARTPIVLISKDDVPSAVSDYIKNTSSFGEVIVLGGTAAISDNSANLLQSQRSGLTLTRIGGFDRFETSRLIDERFFPLPVTSFITGGRAPDGGIPVDAMVIAPYAGPRNGAVSLVKRDDVTDPTRTYLTAHKATLNQMFIVGGTAVVSDATANAAFALII